jgi:predicted kinase
MQTSELNEEIAKNYLAQLQVRDVPHFGLLLTFFGTPGSGKTTLANKLANDLTAQYVRSDAVRRIIQAMGYDPRQFVVSKITELIVKQILAHDANKLIVLDASIDRTWRRFFDYAKKENIPTLTIRLNIPATLLEERIKQRHESDFGKDYLNKFLEQFHDSKNHVKADIELEADYNYDEVLSQVKQLRSKKETM